MTAIFFENKSGIPVTPYKERMIDGSESPNAPQWKFLFEGRVSIKSVVIQVYEVKTFQTIE